jgi:hypothetical protein
MQLPVDFSVSAIRVLAQGVGVGGSHRELRTPVERVNQLLRKTVPLSVGSARRKRILPNVHGRTALDAASSSDAPAQTLRPLHAGGAARPTDGDEDCHFLCDKTVARVRHVHKMVSNAAKYAIKIGDQ